MKKKHLSAGEAELAAVQPLLPTGASKSCCWDLTGSQQKRQEVGEGAVGTLLSSVCSGKKLDVNIWAGGSSSGRKNRHFLSVALYFLSTPPYCCRHHMWSCDCETQVDAHRRCDIITEQPTLWIPFVWNWGSLKDWKIQVTSSAFRMLLSKIKAYILYILV